MIRRLLFVTLTVIISSTSVARETKEQKREHTHNLRRWLQLVDFTFNDGSTPLNLREKRLAEMDSLFDLIIVKLSKKKQAKLSEQYLSYRKDSPFDLPKQLALKAMALKFYRVVTLPAQRPSLELGKKLYFEYCSSCHGDLGGGDGIFTKNPELPMVPLPKGFSELYLTGVRSPYSYFNSLMLGSNGTAMSSYDKTMKSHDLWSLAFFLSVGWQSGTLSEPSRVFP